MKYAIIAAGEGSRLAAEGVAEHKPLVRVHGECLVDRLLRIFASNGADDIFVICNEQYTDVASHLERLEREGLDGQRIPLRHIVKSTPSSMHSFFELSKLIGEGPVVLTTVDTIFRPDDFAKYIAAFEKAYGFETGTSVLDIKESLAGFDYTEEPADQNNAFFLMGTENGTVMKYTFDSTVIMFVFEDNELFAAAIYNNDNWTI